MSQPAPCTDDAPLTTEQFGDTLRVNLKRARTNEQRVVRLRIAQASREDRRVVYLYVTLTGTNTLLCYRVRVSDDTKCPKGRVMRLTRMIVSRLRMGAPGWQRGTRPGRQTGCRGVWGK